MFNRKIKMKTCPFCNATEDILSFSVQPSQSDDRQLCHVYCTECHAFGPMRYNLNDAEEAWDNRYECTHKEAITAAHGYACKECGKFLV